MLDPAVGACRTCPKRSSCAPELFPEELPASDGKTVAGDHCLDPACWQNKATIYLKRRLESLRREHPKLILLNAGDYADRAPLAETFGSEVFNAWDVASGKKSDTSAVPALVVGGSGLGRFKWVVPVKDGSTTPASKRLARKDGDSERAERTAEEKKAPYDKRRRQVVIDAVKTKLEALATEMDRAKLPELEGGEALAGHGLLAKTICFLHAMIEEYGWRDSVAKGRFQLPDDLLWADLSRLKNHELGQTEIRETLLNICWQLLRLGVGRFASRLLVAPGERTNDAQYADTEMICMVLGFNLHELRAQAATLIPYAKSWREEIQDDWARPADSENGNQPILQSTSGN
jgi:hypothetical protein